MKTGKDPKGHIDHEDHNGLNNLWDNLRLTTNKGNQKNLSKRIDNTSGVTGVVKRKNSFIVQIQIDNKMIYLGSRKTLEEAAQLRKEAEIKYGFHKNHGK